MDEAPLPDKVCTQRGGESVSCGGPASRNHALSHFTCESARPPCRPKQKPTRAHGLTHVFFPSHTKVRVLVLGAGPTGLGAAARLHQHGESDWLVLEAVSILLGW